MSSVQAESPAIAAQAYREKMFKLQGQQHPLKVLAGTASAREEIVSRHSVPVLRSRPFEG